MGVLLLSLDTPPQVASLKNYAGGRRRALRRKADVCVLFFEGTYWVVFEEAQMDTIVGSPYLAMSFSLNDVRQRTDIQIWCRLLCQACPKQVG